MSDFTNLNMRIKSDLHRQFKIRTLTEDVSMTDVVVEMIKDYLNGRYSIKGKETQGND